MQNLTPNDFSIVVDHPSGAGHVLDGVIASASAPLLPGEKQADYSDMAVRVVKRQTRGIRSKNSWSATSQISLGKFFAFGAPRPEC